MKKNITVKKHINNSKTYSEIAEIMTKEGHVMNHNSVRNHITKGFMKIVKNISANYNIRHSEDEIKKIAQSEVFQTSLIEIMKDYKK